MLVAVLLAVVVVLGDRALGTAAGWYAGHRAGCPGLGVHITSLPTGTPAAWQLLRGRFGDVAVGGDRVEAAGVVAAVDAHLRDVDVRGAAVGSLDAQVGIGWSEVARYVRASEPFAEATDLRLTGLGGGRVQVDLAVPVLVATVPVRVTADLTAVDGAVVVRTTELSVAGLDTSVLTASLREQVLALASRTWPVELPAGVSLVGVRADADALRVEVGGSDLRRSGLSDSTLCSG